MMKPEALDPRRNPLKNKILLIIGLTCLVLIVGLLAAETFIVKVKSTALHSSPKFYAGSVTALNAGDRLEKVSSQGDWVQVRTASGTVGWIHASALEARKFNLGATGTGLRTQATADEVALASKGFNKQVEDTYRTRNKNISFIWVDRMLLLNISPGQEEAFLKDGKLADFGGGK